MLSETPGKQLSCYVPDYVVFDLETTGLNPQNDAVVEISAVKVLGGEVCYEFSTLVNPERPIPWGASSINHITDRMVQNAPVFRDVFSEFLDFCGDLPLVGHNIHSFDMKFLYRYAAEYWGLTVGNDYIDTLRLARRCMDPKPESFSLGTLAEYFEIPVEGAHRALADCRMNQQVFERLRPLVEAAKREERLCPRCGQPLVKRKGRYGEFMGCTGYPDCTYTEKLSSGRRGGITGKE